MKDRLGPLVREAQAELGVREARGVDWDKVDEKLFARIEREERAARLPVKRPGHGRAWLLAAAGLAAVVAGAVVLGKPQTGPVLEARAPVAPRVAATVSSGEATVNGHAAGVGAEVHTGEVVEASLAVRMESPGDGTSPAPPERGQSRKLWMLLEAGSLARVEEARPGLFLSLEKGAVEADVTPVATGEAFAVDVVEGDDRVRVAVHGTHLRVERRGSHVTVDLNEGVVSLGVPPRTGSTLGTLVTAPAHAEFSVTDLAGTLVVSHEAAAVRSPVSLKPGPQPRPVVVPATPPAPHAEASSRATAGGSGPVAARSEPRPSPQNKEEAPASSAPAASAGPALPPVDPDADATLTAAVRACMQVPPSADGITAVVSTTVRLELNDDGTVRHAHYDPPVATDVYNCATPRIYKTRFPHGGSASIPVDVTAPSSAP